MAIGLEGGATGVSYVLLPDKKMEDYTTLKPDDFIGKNPKNLAFEFGNKDPIKEMMSLALSLAGWLTRALECELCLFIWC